MPSKDDAPRESHQVEEAPKTPEEAMAVWKAEVDALPSLEYGQTKDRLGQIFSIRIPADLLKPEAYIAMLGRLQQLRAEVMQLRSEINDHWKVRSKAVKSLLPIFRGMSGRGTVADREAEAENWLIYVQRSVVHYEVLKDRADDAIDLINRSIADVVTQIKTINFYGVPTGMLDASMAVDIPDSWEQAGESDTD
ncbi:MAG: hypothetical protein PHH96_07450 [Smithellaceae bacterium]|jgi:hypothetical protein|nr:hypothetical protein [Smithellaceae bacterium]